MKASGSDMKPTGPIPEKGCEQEKCFATLDPSSGDWKTLCGKPATFHGALHGTFVAESQITCPDCRPKWKAGMRRVNALLRTYRGEL